MRLLPSLKTLSRFVERSVIAGLLASKAVVSLPSVRDSRPPEEVGGLNGMALSCLCLRRSRLLNLSVADIFLAVGSGGGGGGCSPSCTVSDMGGGCY